MRLCKTTMSLLSALCMATISHLALAEQSRDGIWSDVAETSISSNQQRDIVPARYRTVSADVSALQALLSRAPSELSWKVLSSPLILELPMPAAGFERYRIVESPIMAPELAARYPEIRTYLGQGIDDPSASVRLDITSAGFHAMVISAGHVIFIDPYGRGGTRDYICYFKEDLQPDRSGRFEEIGVVDPNSEMSLEISRLVASGRTALIGEQLRTYRLALAATGEYTAFHGGTVQAGMAAIVTAMNRVDGVYEREVAIRMVLVANNDQLVYTNAATDPYTNNNGSTMLGQNQTNIDAVIGSANYDIGHVFSTGVGGIAGLGVVCISGQKAHGVTGSPTPVGDGFYIDYVAHEMGHQFGGNHSFNSVTSNCGGGNRNGSTAYEPGSGTTVMAYAGICGADDIQPHSDDYFHVISIDEIVAYTTQGPGSSCPVVTATGNSAPIVSIGPGGNTIPLRTPFYLTGSAIDPDGDTLTYTWEEFDLGPAGSPNSPSGNAPIFRSFKGTTNPTRTFPRLADILNNTQTIGEILPTYARNLSFQLTARDSRAGGGGVGRSSTMTIGVSAAAGPFSVAPFNSWVSNSTDTVRWNVANTNLPPISCTNVNILLSTDGGQSFPLTLASNTANDGVEPIQVPSLLTETARVKVEAVGNIFFDISRSNFGIGSIVAPRLSSPPDSSTGVPSTVTLHWQSSPGASSYRVQVSTVPTFSTVLIDDSTVTDSSRAVSALNSNSQYFWRVKARNANGASGWSEVWTFRTAQLPPAAPLLSSPPNGATNQPTTLTLRWGAVIGATSFRVQVSTDSTFAAMILDDSSVTTIQRTVTLSSGTTYYWHVRARNAGGPGLYSSTWNFTTLVTSVSAQTGPPREFALSQNYPNPFNPTTVIEYALPRESMVKLEVYSVLGERVATLVNRAQPAGFYSAPFDGKNLASGLYMYRLEAGGFVQTRKLLLVR